MRRLILAIDLYVTFPHVRRLGWRWAWYRAGRLARTGW